MGGGVAMLPVSLLAVSLIVSLTVSLLRASGEMTGGTNISFNRRLPG